jgi:hypothetical protein
MSGGYVYIGAAVRSAWVLEKIFEIFPGTVGLPRKRIGILTLFWAHQALWTCAVRNGLYSISIRRWAFLPEPLSSTEFERIRKKYPRNTKCISHTTRTLCTIYFENFIKDN